MNMTDDFVTSEMISRELAAVERDIRRLRRKVRRLEAERDVLRNVAAIVRTFVEQKRKQRGEPIDGEPANTSSFLHSAIARSLSLDGVLRMSEEDAYWTFQRIRWHEHDGQPQCPRCNCGDLYVCRAEHLWKCKGCGYRFSVTSGTIFASRKMAIRDILIAIAIVTNGEKRISALQLSRELGVSYKTALDLAHRIRGSTPRATGRQPARSGLQRARRPEVQMKAVKFCP